MKRMWNIFFAALLALAAPGNASPFEEGNALFREGKFEAAEAAYNRSLAQDGDAAALPVSFAKSGSARWVSQSPHRLSFRWIRPQKRRECVYARAALRV